MPVLAKPVWLDDRLRIPVRLVKVSVPFAGIGGPDRALAAGGWLHEVVNVFEKRATCIPVLNAIAGREAVDKVSYKVGFNESLG